MKIFNIIFVVLFVLFAALQYNDPDPWLWIPIYLFGAFVCWLCARGNYNRPALIGGLVFFGAYAIYLFFEEDGVLSWLTTHKAENIAGSMKASKPWIEDTREFFGLAILIIVFAINLSKARKSQ